MDGRGGPGQMCRFPSAQPEKINQENEHIQRHVLDYKQIENGC